MKIIPVLFVVLLAASSCADPDEYTALSDEEQKIASVPLKNAAVKCLSVESPDSITVLYQGRELKISLLGLITPAAKNEAVYELAKRHLNALAGEELIIETVKGPVKGRVAALIYCNVSHKPVAAYGNQTEFSRNVTAEFVELGYAKVDKNTMPPQYLNRYLALEKKAVQERKGFWNE